jgi:hypothetical protein
MEKFIHESQIMTYDEGKYSDIGIPGFFDILVSDLEGEALDSEYVQKYISLVREAAQALEGFWISVDKACKEVCFGMIPNVTYPYEYALVFTVDNQEQRLGYKTCRYRSLRCDPKQAQWEDIDIQRITDSGGIEPIPEIMLDLDKPDSGM